MMNTYYIRRPSRADPTVIRYHKVVHAHVLDDVASDQRATEEVVKRAGYRIETACDVCTQRGGSIQPARNADGTLAKHDRVWRVPGGRGGRGCRGCPKAMPTTARRVTR